MHPDVFVLVESRGAQFLAEALLLRRLDAAIITLPFEHGTVQSEALQAGPMVCVMPKGHALTAKKLIEPKDIGNTPFVGFGSTSQTRRRVEGAFEIAKVRLNMVIEADTAQNVAEFVAQGFGVTVGRHIFFEAVADRVEIRPFTPTLTDDLRVLRPVRARNSSLVDTFVEAVHFAVRHTA